MNKLISFTYQDSTVHTLTIEGEPWFIAKDVCQILNLANPRSTFALLDEDEKGVHTMDTPGGTQELTTVSEAGLYALILKSRKPEAKTFKRWVTHEVLPTIRSSDQVVKASACISDDFFNIGSKMEAAAIEDWNGNVSFTPDVSAKGLILDASISRKLCERFSFKGGLRSDTSTHCLVESFSATDFIKSLVPVFHAIRLSDSRQIVTI